MSWNQSTRGILYTSRGMHSENSGTSNSGNLLVLVESNDATLIDDIPEGKIPIFAKQPSKTCFTDKVAMTLGLYHFDNHLPPENSPAFVIQASSLRALVNELWKPKLYIWTMQSSLSVKLHSRFAQTEEEIEQLLLSPVVDELLSPTFVGVLPDASISEAWAAKLRKRCTGEYDAGDLLSKLESLQNEGAEKAHAKLHAEAAERYTMAIKFARVIWDCHLQCIREDKGHDMGTSLWLLSADGYASRTQMLLNKASESQPEGLESYEEARRNAEEGIAFLTSHEPFGKPDEADEEMLYYISKSKAKVSFRAAMACQGLGHRDAAVRHLQQAMLYEPESGAIIQKSIDDLLAEKPEQGKDAIRNPVLW